MSTPVLHPYYLLNGIVRRPAARETYSRTSTGLVNLIYCSHTRNTENYCGAMYHVREVVIDNRDRAELHLPLSMQYSKTYRTISREIRNSVPALSRGYILPTSVQLPYYHSTQVQYSLNKCNSAGLVGLNSRGHTLSGPQPLTCPKLHSKFWRPGQNLKSLRLMGLTSPRANNTSPLSLTLSIV